MKNKGFSLVELIVVIAIMAILVGVAVPVYSSYIEKTQKAADQQLVDEIKHAMEIANAAQTLTESAYVKIDASGAKVGGPGADQLEAVLEATFGDNWETELKVKYSGWKGVTSTVNYAGSSYNGKEGELIGVVDKLTSALGEVVKTDPSMGSILFDSTFGDFLTEKNVDKDNGKAIGNAAVLYVAEQTVGREKDIQDAFNAVLVANGGAVTANTVNNIYTELLNRGFGEVASTAAIYAYAEGYAQQSGQAAKFHEMNFDGVNDGLTACTRLSETLGGLELGDDFADYVMNGQGAKDLSGYIEMMGTVTDFESEITGSLNNADCFTDGVVEGWLMDYAAMSELEVSTANGQVAVIFSVDTKGVGTTHVAPLNWDK